jgi:drug/metabolite transporter (DMT)-like permease
MNDQSFIGHALGIVLVLLGTGINNVGIFLQKRQTNRVGQAGRGGISPFLRDPLWLLGIAMQTILCLPFYVRSVSLIGITLAQPLSNAGVLFLVLCLVLFLGERLVKGDFIALAILVSGMVAVGAGGVGGEVAIEVFLSEGKRVAIIVFTISLAALFAVLVFLLRARRLRRYALGALGGLSYAVVSIALQVFSSTLASPANAGIATGTLVVLRLASPAVFVGFTAAGIFAIQEAYRLGPALDIIPFSQAPLNLVPVLAGIILFDQKVERPGLFVYGIVAIIASASMLARFQEGAETTL